MYLLIRNIEFHFDNDIKNIFCVHPLHLCHYAFNAIIYIFCTLPNVNLKQTKNELTELAACTIHKLL